MEALVEKLRSIDDLPVLQDTALRLLMALMTASPNYQDIEELVRYDEALMAAILRRANSAAYASASAQPPTLREAISRLGIRELRRIALAQQSAALMVSGGLGYGLRRRAMWRGAVWGAVAAEVLCEHLKLEQMELCFVAALLRDIGKLAVDRLMPPAQWASTLEARPAASVVTEWEAEVMEYDHARVGAGLARVWKLPSVICTAIEQHHGGGPKDVSPISSVVHCADAIVLWLGAGVGVDGLAYTINTRAFERIGLGLATIEDLLPTIIERASEITEEGGE